MNIETRQQLEVNNDPQRRCYNGCHFSTELVWTPWEVLDSTCTPDNIEKRLTFWRELNDYAISERGEGARREFRIT